MKKIFVKISLLLILSGIFLQAGGETTVCYDDVPDTVSLRDSLLKIVPVRDSLWKDQDINLFYGISFYKDGILFMDNTRNKLGVLSEYVSFGDNATFYAPLKKDLEPGDPDLFSKHTPFPYPPAALTIGNNNNEILVTKSKKERSGKIIYAIYRITKDTSSNKWIMDPQPLPICQGSYSCMQPALSPDGRILVFVSDMPAGKNGLNLFVTLKKNLGWSKPQSLPYPVNSDADELFPFLDEYNNLYFSSGRDSATDGFDIFFSPFNGSGWDQAYKLNRKTNTGIDDMIWRIKPHDTLALLISFPDTGQPYAKLFGISLSDSLKYLYAKAHMHAPEDTMEHAPSVAAQEQLSQKKQPVNELAASTTKKPVVVPVLPPPQPKQKPAPTPQKKYTDVVFKVQIVASMIPSGSYAVWINHKKYYTWEYFYQGAYRYTIGEFDNVEDALKLKALCRQQGYPQAFVAAFRHNKRVLDPEVFKH